MKASNIVRNGAQSFIVAGWCVDPASLRISKGKKTLKLEPKTMAVLSYLASNPGTVISRQELEEQVWAGSVIGYDAISNTITKLRKAFGDKAREPRIIETIAKSGYRLIAEVVLADETNLPISDGRRSDELAFDRGSALHNKSAKPNSPVLKSGWRPIASATFLLLVAALITALWWLLSTPLAPEKPVQAYSDHPSIAVLPFSNMSGEAAQEYFVDGLTDDLITDISKIPGLFVIARNSVFVYKGQNVDIRQVGNDLGVQYILEGSVRLDGKQVRINAQLIDTATGGHIWAERYDGKLEDVFAIQDTISQKIVNALAVKLDSDTHNALTRSYTDSVEAYDHFLHGRDHFFRRSKADNDLAKTHFVKAIDLDPDFALAYSMLAWAHSRDVINGWSDTPARSLDQAYQAVRQALALDHRLAQAYFVKALVHRSKKDHVQAAAEAEKAIEIEPNYADAYVLLASLLYYSGGAQKGLELIHKAQRLNPNYPSNYPFHLGQAHFLLRQYNAAANAFQAALDSNPNSERSHIWLAATYAQSGNIDEASFEADEIIALDPDFSVRRMRDNAPLKNPIDLEHFIDGLRKAGLPE